MRILGVAAPWHARWDAQEDQSKSSIVSPHTPRHRLGHMAVPKGWTGSCAPLIYMAQCPEKHLKAYQIYAQVWLALNALALLSLLTAFIRRYIVVSERFNTLRLLMIKLMLSLVMNITFDILRSASVTSFGASPAFTGWLWVSSWIGALGGLILLTVTWMSFSSKNLMARPVITGNWPLYLAFMIPLVVGSFILGAVAGISYKVYLIAMRACMAAWSGLMLLLFAVCLYHGRSTWNHLRAIDDKFQLKQHMRAYIFISSTLGIIGVFLGVSSFFLDAIDKSLIGYLIALSVSRANALFVYFSCSIYVWIATTRWKYNPRTFRTSSANSTALNTDSQLSPRPTSKIAKEPATTSSSSTDRTPHHSEDNPTEAQEDSSTTNTSGSLSSSV